MNTPSKEALPVIAANISSSAKQPDVYPSPAETPDATSNPPNSATPHQETEPAIEETPEEKLISRIRAAITYTISCRNSNQKPTIYSNFTIPITNPPSTALTLLRTAASANIATLIGESKGTAQYSLPVPPVQREKPFNFAITSPQWWMGMKKAEIRAGPGADEAKLKQAERYVRMREVNERKGARSKFLGAERHNLLIGLAMQGDGRDATAGASGEAGGAEMKGKDGGETQMECGKSGGT